ncbi:MAG: WYL domain-containing protein [Coriobacteriia bacterium]|nr:WYL domain-containing protein [Coriobacteriia bacterium]
MARTSADQRARRLLALLHLFEPDARLSIDSLARTLGAGETEITRDLELLSMCAADQRDPNAFVPVMIEDGYVEVFGTLPALETPVRLSAAEVGALAAALQVAGVDADDDLLRRLLEAAAATDVDAASIERALRSTTSGGIEALANITFALHEHRVTHITYHGVGKGIPGDRDIEPLSLHNDKGVWYLRARCRTAGAVRTFRVDRIRTSTVTEEVFEAAGHEPSTTVIDTASLPVARIKLAPGERFSAREWPGVRPVDVAEDGSTVVEVPYAGTGWISRQVLARLGRAEVLSPTIVREAVSDLANDALGR